MNRMLADILSACVTLHKVEKEVEKEFFIKRYFKKRKIKSIVYDIEEKIKELMDDEWDIDYLYQLQNTLFLYHTQFNDFQDGLVTISGFDPDKEINYKKFYPMYFVDNRHDKERLIYLTIVAENIGFRIIDTATGNSFTVESKYSVQNSQKKIENVCKHILVKYILNYLHKNM